MLEGGPGAASTEVWRGRWVTEPAGSTRARQCSRYLPGQPNPGWARVGQGALCRLARDRGRSGVQNPWGEQLCCPVAGAGLTPVPLGGCSTGQTHPAPGTARGLPLGSCWNAADLPPRSCSCSGLSADTQQVPGAKGQHGALQEAELKPSLPCQCCRTPGELRGPAGAFPVLSPPGQRLKFSRGQGEP